MSKVTLSVKRTLLLSTLYTPCNGKYHLSLVLLITYRLKHVILVNDGKLLAAASIS